MANETKTDGACRVDECRRALLGFPARPHSVPLITLARWYAIHMPCDADPRDPARWIEFCDISSRVPGLGNKKTIQIRSWAMLLCWFCQREATHA